MPELTELERIVLRKALEEYAALPSNYPKSHGDDPNTRGWMQAVAHDLSLRLT